MYRESCLALTKEPDQKSCLQIVVVVEVEVEEVEEKEGKHFDCISD